MTFGPSHSPLSAWIPRGQPFSLLLLQSLHQVSISLIYIYIISHNSFILAVAADFQACHWFSADSDYAKEWEVDMYTRAGDKSSISFFFPDNVTGYATWQAIHLFGPPAHPLRFVHAEYTLSKFPSSPFPRPAQSTDTVRALLYEKRRPSLLSSLPTSQENGRTRNVWSI